MKDRQKTEEALLARVDKTPGYGPEGECWHWMGVLNGQGYGYLGVDGKSVGVHRLSYELYHAAIPVGLLVRHSCDNRKCVNPKHLSAGTHLENMADRRSRGPNKRTDTACRHGHPYSQENTYIVPATGIRACKQCKQAARRKSKSKAKKQTA